MNVFIRKSLVTVFLFYSFFCVAAGTYVPTSKELHQMEERLVKLINKERSKYGLAGLCTWKVLHHYAHEHSQNMAMGLINFGHDGFEGRAKAIKKYDLLRSFGENVAYCYLIENPLQVAVKGWMESPGHRKNILDDFEETGIAIVCDEKGGFYMTQLFAKRMRK